MANRKRDKPVHFMATALDVDHWKAKATASGMSLREWITRSLDAAPILRVDIQPAAGELER